MSSPPRFFQAVLDHATAISNDDPDIAHIGRWEDFDEELKKELEEIEDKRRRDRLASKVEKLDEFAKLESELLPLGLGQEVTVISSSGSFRRREVQPVVPLSEVFDRLGVYQDILAGEPSQVIWERLEAALKSEPREIKTLFLLQGGDVLTVVEI